MYLYYIHTQWQYTHTIQNSITMLYTSGMHMYMQLTKQEMRIRDTDIGVKIHVAVVNWET